MARGKANATANIQVQVTPDTQGAVQAINVVKNMETQIDKSTANTGKKASQNLNKGVSDASKALDALRAKAEAVSKKVDAALGSSSSHIQKRAADVEFEREKQVSTVLRNQGNYTRGAQTIEARRIVAEGKLEHQRKQKELEEFKTDERIRYKEEEDAIMRRRNLRQQANRDLQRDYQARETIIKRAMSNPTLKSEVSSLLGGDVNTLRRLNMMSSGMTRTEAFAAQLQSLGTENINYLTGVTRTVPAAFGGKDRDAIAAARAEAEYQKQSAGYWSKVYAERNRIAKAEQASANQQLGQLRRENERIDRILDKMRHAPAALQAQVADVLRSAQGRQAVQGYISGGMSTRMAYRNVLSGIGGIGGGGASWLTGGGGPPPPNLGPRQPGWLGNAIGGAGRFIGASLGVGIGAYAVGNLMRGAGEDVKRATAYERQRLAAESLAGSQAKLNDLMDAYQEASGGVVDKSEAIASLSRLMATGYADTSEEVEKFVRATRGASIAMGQQQDYIVQETQLAMSNTSFRRLDQIGLGIDEVRQRMAELRSENAAMNRETAFQVAVMDVMERKYGALSESLAGQKTGVEQAAAAWKDMRLAFGELLKVPVNNVADYMAERFRELGDVFLETRDAAKWLADEIDRMSGMKMPTVSAFGIVGQPQAPVREVDPEADALKVEWYKRREEIEEETGKQIADTIEQYNEQRAKTIANYEKQIAREARDYAKQRLRQEQEFQDSMEDLNLDIRRREQQRDKDYARSVEETHKSYNERVADLEEDRAKRAEDIRENHAEKLEDMEKDRSKRIAELHENSADRILEMEEDFAKQREYSMEQYNLNRKNAVARLDARALYELEEQFKLEQRKAQEAHEEQLRDEEESLEKAVDKVNESYRERLADEEKALKKSIEQNNEALAEQLAEEKKKLDESLEQQKKAYWEQRNEALLNDALRKEEMIADFKEQRRREAEDRATMEADRQADFQDQLNEMANENLKRINQIQQHGIDQRTELDKQFEEDLAQIGIFTSEYTKRLNQLAVDAARAFDLFWEELLGKVTSPVPEVAPVPKPEKSYQGKTQSQWVSDYNYNMIEANKYPKGDILRAYWEESANQIADILVKEFGLEDPRLKIPVTDPKPADPNVHENPRVIPSSLYTPADPGLVGAASSVSNFGGNSSNTSATYVVSSGAINIVASPGQSVEELGLIIEERLIAALERAAVAYA